MLTMMYSLIVTIALNGAVLMNNVAAVYGDCGNKAFYYATVDISDDGIEIVEGPHFECG